MVAGSNMAAEYHDNLPSGLKTAMDAVRKSGNEEAIVMLRDAIGTAKALQLKDVAAVLEAEHPYCHQHLCFKTGTKVPNNETLASVVSRVTGLQVRNAQVTMAGQVKVRGPIQGYRKVRAVLVASHAS